MDARDAMALISGLRGYGYAIEDVFPHAAERRRHVLLGIASDCYWRGMAEGIHDWTYCRAVETAKRLLAEIESREGK